MTDNLGYRTVNSIFTGNKQSVDVKKTVGSACKISDIDYFVTEFSDFVIEGHLVEDYNNGITWQIYKKNDGSFGYRPQDGIYHVKTVVDVTGGLGTSDNVSLSEGDRVLYISSVPQFNGIYKYSSDYGATPHRRVPIFDETSDSLSNVIIKVDEGERWQDSLWVYTSQGSDFTQTELSDLTPTSDYSDLGGHYWGFDIANEFVNFYDELITDSWHVFETIAGSYPPVTTTDAENTVSYTSPAILADSSSNGINLDYSTPLIPNKPYSALKLSSDNYVTYTNGALSDAFPDALAIKYGDMITTVCNPVDNSFDINYYSYGGQELWKFSVGNYTAAGALTDTIPAGWNIFSIKGTCSGAEYAILGLGTTSDASDIITTASSSFSPSSDVSIPVTFGEMETNWTTDTTLYITDALGFSDAPSGVDIELCLYKDTRG